MTEAFILGMDASIVPSLEAGGVRYYDFDGKEKDVFEILSENGSTTSGFGCGWILTTAPAGATAVETATSAPPSPSASEPPGTA